MSSVLELVDAGWQPNEEKTTGLPPTGQKHRYEIAVPWLQPSEAMGKSVAQGSVLSARESPLFLPRAHPGCPPAAPDQSRSYAAGCSQPLGVEREICCSSSVISTGISANSGVLR